MSEKEGPKQSGGLSHVQDDGNGENKPRTAFQLFIGYFLLFGCVCFWQGMGMILQSIENPASDSREKPYRAFYYMTWWIHNGFLFSLLVWILTQKFHYHLDILPRLLDRHVLKMTLIGSTSALVGTMMWYYSLQRTILSANNVIYQTTPLFVFLFSIKILGEKVTRNKIIAFVFFMLGIICVTIFTKATKSGGETQESTPLGYILCLGATVCYAGYEVFFAWQERKAKEKEVPGTPKRNSIMDSLLFVGMMGFWNMFVLWPGIFLVEWVGLEEKFSYPSDFVAIEIVGVAACEVGMHMFLLSGIAVMGPVFMAVGGIMILPLGYLVDIIKGINHSAGNYVGCLLVVLGFLIIENVGWVIRFLHKLIGPDPYANNEDEARRPSRSSFASAHAVYEVLDEPNEDLIEEELRSIM